MATIFVMSHLIMIISLLQQSEIVKCELLKIIPFL